jgi:hypothetical protein
MKQLETVKAIIGHILFDISHMPFFGEALV